MDSSFGTIPKQSGVELSLEKLFAEIDSSFGTLPKQSVVELSLEIQSFSSDRNYKMNQPHGTKEVAKDYLSSKR